LAKRDEQRDEHKDQDEEDMGHSNYKAGEDLENHFTKMELQLVKQLSNAISNSNEQDSAAEFYGLPVFWDICCDQVVSNNSGNLSGESTITPEIQ
jgi:hypothetical protein